MLSRSLVLPHLNQVGPGVRISTGEGRGQINRRCSDGAKQQSAATLFLRSFPGDGRISSMPDLSPAVRPPNKFGYADTLMGVAMWFLESVAGTLAHCAGAAWCIFGAPR